MPKLTEAVDYARPSLQCHCIPTVIDAVKFMAVEEDRSVAAVLRTLIFEGLVARGRLVTPRKEK